MGSTQALRAPSGTTTATAGTTTVTAAMITGSDGAPATEPLEAPGATNAGGVHRHPFGGDLGRQLGERIGVEVDGRDPRTTGQQLVDEA